MNKNGSLEVFSSRFGVIIAVLGIAVGTGNIWRFPRIVSQNDGGTFLIPWAIFLVLWSLPLIIAEFAIGRYTHYGNIGSFVKLIGKKYAWMGAFIALVATAIMFYYSVVTGWTLFYLWKSLTGDLPQTYSSSLFIWDSFIDSNLPLMFHGIAIMLGVSIVYQGVVRGIERVCRFIVPILFIILVIAAIRAITLRGAFDGLEYLFTPNLSNLLKVEIWLNALTQNAWDTGAGWGLILTYAAYVPRDRDTNLNAALIGFGNNAISLLAAITIFSTIFAILGSQAEAILKEAGPASTGLTFIWMPQLFAQMPGGQVFAPLFFLGLAFAAFSSLISMIELAGRSLMDRGIARNKAIIIVGAVSFLAGIPSAYSVGFLVNQDWVWGVGLMISGAFIAFAVVKYGEGKFLSNIVNIKNPEWRVGKWWGIVMKYQIPFQVSVLLIWWLFNSTKWYPETWWHPFNLNTPETFGTCIAQWGIAIVTLLIFNKRLSKIRPEQDAL